MVKGYHMHQRVWESSVGNELMCQRERGNLIDPFNHMEIFEQVLFSFDCWLFELYENKTFWTISSNTAAKASSH